MPVSIVLDACQLFTISYVVYQGKIRKSDAPNHEQQFDGVGPSAFGLGKLVVVDGQDILKERNLVSSMCRHGNCYANAVAEDTEREMVKRRICSSCEEAQSDK